MPQAPESDRNIPVVESTFEDNLDSIRESTFRPEPVPAIPVEIDQNLVSGDNSNNAVYDAAGNLTKLSVGGKTVEMKYDKNNRMTQAETRDKNGNLEYLQTVNYNDNTGARTDTGTSYNPDGSKNNEVQIKQNYIGGKLRQESTRYTDFSDGREISTIKTSKFDQQGNEIETREGEGGVNSITKRTFNPDKTIDITCEQNRGLSKTIAKAKFDADGKQIEPTIAQQYANGEVVSEMETSADGNYKKYSEKGILKAEVLRGFDKDTKTTNVFEAHYDNNGQPIKTVRIDFDKDLMSANHIEVRDQDGNITESFDMAYSEKNNNRQPIKTIIHSKTFEGGGGEIDSSRWTKSQDHQKAAWQYLNDASEGVKPYTYVSGLNSSHMEQGIRIEAPVQEVISAEESRNNYNRPLSRIDAAPPAPN